MSGELVDQLPLFELSASLGGVHSSLAAPDSCASTVGPDRVKGARQGIAKRRVSALDAGRDGRTLGVDRGGRRAHRKVMDGDA